MTQPELFRQACEIAISNGFSFYDKCNCGGWSQYHYKKGNVLLKIGVNSSRIQLHEGNKKGPVLFRGHYGQLQQAIDENPS